MAKCITAYHVTHVNKGVAVGDWYTEQKPLSSKGATEVKKLQFQAALKIVPDPDVLSNEVPELYDFALAHPVTLYLGEGDIQVETLWMTIREGGQLAYVSTRAEVQAALAEEARLKAIEIPGLSGISTRSLKALATRRILTLADLRFWSKSRLRKISGFQTGPKVEVLAKWAASHGVILEE